MILVLMPKKLLVILKINEWNRNNSSMRFTTFKRLVLDFDFSNILQLGSKC